MAAKFPKSNIFISSQINIFIKKENGDTENIGIGMGEGLKQSKSGVYCLRNKLNGRLYIGMARNLENRKNSHFRNLMSCEHVNKLLLSDYAEIGGADITGEGLHPSEIFEFEIIIYCYPSELTFWEKMLIDNLHPYYNIKRKKEISLDILEELEKQIFVDSELID